MVGGLAHKYVMNENTYIRSSLSATHSKDHTLADLQTDDKLINVEIFGTADGTSFSILI